MRYIIDDKFSGMLLREYLRGVLGLSHGTLTVLKKDPRGILLNGEHATVRAVLSAGDELSLALEDAESALQLQPVDLPVDVLYEDGACVVCSKPPFMPTHPSHGHYTDTLANALAFRYAERGVPFVFRAVNRLDSGTSGAVLVARSRAAAAIFGQAMQSGGIGKVYLALLRGEGLPDSGVINAPIARLRESIILRGVAADGDRALTRYRCICTCTVGGERCTAVLAEPITGRTHQLRVHFSHIGHPIYGDTLYPVREGLLDALTRRRETGEELPQAETEGALIDRQALHAALLCFDTPVGLTGETDDESTDGARGGAAERGRTAPRTGFAVRHGTRVRVSAPLPDDIRVLLDGETENRINEAIARCRDAGSLCGECDMDGLGSDRSADCLHRSRDEE